MLRVTQMTGQLLWGSATPLLPFGPCSWTQKGSVGEEALCSMEPALSCGCAHHMVLTLAMALHTPGLGLLFLDVPPNQSKALEGMREM